MSQPQNHTLKNEAIRDFYLLESKSLLQGTSSKEEPP